MKTHTPIIAAALMTLSTLASAQVTTVTQSSTTGYGTVSQYSPGETIIVSQDSGAPIRYAVTQGTVFVDENGTPVAVERITSGIPITVNYVREGDRMVASRVIVKKTVTTSPSPAPIAETTRTTTTTTTGAGTVTEFAPGSQSMILRSSSGDAPLTYGVSSSTTYVDETGAPVAVEKIAPGVPVTVHYIREGDRMVANRVVVTRTTTTAPARRLTEDEREELEERREERKEKAEERREEAQERREERRND